MSSIRSGARRGADIWPPHWSLFGRDEEGQGLPGESVAHLTVLFTFNRGSMFTHFYLCVHLFSRSIQNVTASIRSVTLFWYFMAFYHSLDASGVLGQNREKVTYHPAILILKCLQHFPWFLGHSPCHMSVFQEWFCSLVAQLSPQNWKLEIWK